MAVRPGPACAMASPAAASPASAAPRASRRCPLCMLLPFFGGHGWVIWPFQRSRDVTVTGDTRDTGVPLPAVAEIMAKSGCRARQLVKTSGASGCIEGDPLGVPAARVVFPPSDQEEIAAAVTGMLASGAL